MFVRLWLRSFHIYDLLLAIGLITLIVYLCLPFRFASHYEYIEESRIEEALLTQVTRNVSLQEVFECDYSEIIAENRFVYHLAHYHDSVQRGAEIHPGGEFRPEGCQARYSTAIIVPYRQREEQLHAFLTYMHNYLPQQLIHYRIFLVEQFDHKPFNRAMLFNIGAQVAAEYGFPCLILHDVDLLPLNSGQIYACTERPRHMCSALDHWRFRLPYRGLFGGVVAINTVQFQQINGMSNLYHGWGGEDDDHKCCKSFIKNSYCVGMQEPEGYSEQHPTSSSTVAAAEPATQVQFKVPEVPPERPASEVDSAPSSESSSSEEEEVKPEKKKSKKKSKKREKKKKAKEQRKQKSKYKEAEEEEEKAKKKEVPEELDDRKRAYNSMYDVKAPTEDEIEEWKKKRPREEDPMLQFM